MRPDRGRIRLTVVAVALLCGLAGCRHDVPRVASAPAGTVTLEQGVRLMRVLMTAEFEQAGRLGPTPGRYGTLPNVLALWDVADFRPEVTVVDSESGLFDGAPLRLWLTASGYSASLVPNQPKCALAFFADERGVIYTGYGLGCDDDKPAPNRPTATDALSRVDAVYLLRDLLTAQYAMRGQGGDFGTLSEVVASSGWADPKNHQRVDPAIQSTDAVSGTVLNDTLRIRTSVDKKHFQADLVPTKAGCGISLFVDDRSVIYVGKGLGC